MDNSEKMRKIKPPQGRNSRMNQKMIGDQAEGLSILHQRSTLRSLSTGKGSLTIEASLTFPLFLILAVTILSFFNIMDFESRLQYAMGQAGKQLASATATAELTPILIRTLTTEELDKENTSYTSVKGGKDGLSFFGSLYDPLSHDVMIRVSYEMRIPYFSDFGISFSLSQTVRCRVWIGDNEEGQENEAVVFVTANGEVYHTSLSCTYLDLSISEVPISAVPYRRNKSGGKYYPCERCTTEAGDRVFITDYGDRYHASGNCSGLKRDIRSVPLSEVGGLPLCTRCKAREGQ